LRGSRNAEKMSASVSEQDLMGIDAGAPMPQTRALIVKSGKLHAVRSVLGSLATIAFLSGSISA